MNAIGGKTIAYDAPPLPLFHRRIAVANCGGGASARASTCRFVETLSRQSDIR
jgi:hypothetical protein